MINGMFLRCALPMLGGHWTLSRHLMGLLFFVLLGLVVREVLNHVECQAGKLGSAVFGLGFTVGATSTAQYFSNFGSLS